jgi:cytochrome b561
MAAADAFALSSGMPCLLALLAFFFPRLIIIILALSGYIGQAYQTVLWPLLGFFFLPYTTLAYAWAMNTAGNVSGIYLFVVIIAVLLDLGTIGGGGASTRSRTVVVRRRTR